jgi:hypothetical protein
MIVPSASDSSAQGEGPNTLGSERAVRIRLLECRLERRPSAISRVIVEFSAPGDDAPNIVCQREGTACPAGDLRLASLATLDAVSRATAGALQVELIGAKPLRAFDENLVVVAGHRPLRGPRHEDHRRGDRRNRLAAGHVACDTGRR